MIGGELHGDTEVVLDQLDVPVNVEATLEHAEETLVDYELLKVVALSAPGFADVTRKGVMDAAC